jgi:hypothetical protein
MLWVYVQTVQRLPVHSKFAVSKLDLVSKIKNHILLDYLQYSVPMI